MAGRVFISCGQATPDEVAVATNISSWLHSKGFDPYVAIETQSILDLNSGIIGELKKSDFYLFINFRRDNIGHLGSSFFRGSVFTNQELSIAYAMEFEKCLFINQKGVKREGIFQYMVSNTPEFGNLTEVLSILQTAVVTAKWHPSYSRNLAYNNLHWGKPIGYGDHTGWRNAKVLHIDILNNRPDHGASNAVARLKSLMCNSIKSKASDRSHLKCSGSPGYSNTIWPKDYVRFDLLSIDMDNQSNIFLHSAQDIKPRVPIISTQGNYTMLYEVFAESFPPISFSILLNVTGNEATTTANII